MDQCKPMGSNEIEGLFIYLFLCGCVCWAYDLFVSLHRWDPHATLHSKIRERWMHRKLYLYIHICIKIFILASWNISLNAVNPFLIIFVFLYVLCIHISLDLDAHLMQLAITSIPPPWIGMVLLFLTNFVSHSTFLLLIERVLLL